MLVGITKDKVERGVNEGKSVLDSLLHFFVVNGKHHQETDSVSLIHLLSSDPAGRRGIMAVKQVCCRWFVMVTALTLDVGDAVALMRRAEVRAVLGRREDAIDDYRRAVHLHTRPVYHQHQTIHKR